MQADKDYLNLAKVYRSIGNAIGASIISVAGYFGGPMLMMIFPFSSSDRYDAIWGVVIFITLAMCSTSLAFTCILIVQLHKTSKNQGQPLLAKHMRFWIATTCVSIMIVAWCGIWFFTSIYFKYYSYYDADLGYWVYGNITIRLWPTMPSNVENWIKLMNTAIPAIGFAIVYLPFYNKQMQALKPLFPPSRSQWFPSSGHEGVKWATIGAKLGWVTALSAIFIPIFITYAFIPRGHSPMDSYIFNCMLAGIIAASISTCGHGFAAVVAGTKSQFKFARAFIGMYREQAGLPPLPDGYRIPPGLLTRPAFFSPNEGDMNPVSYMGYARRNSPRYGDAGGAMEEQMDGQTGYPVGMRAPAAPATRAVDTTRSWFIQPPEGNANSNPGIPSRTIEPPTPNPRPPAPENEAPALPETSPSGAEASPAERKPPASKAPAGSDDLKLDFTDIQ